MIIFRHSVQITDILCSTKGVSKYMWNIIYNVVSFISRIHYSILSWNDQIENSFTDKQLHFMVIGAFGIALILVLHPIFLWLAKTGHTIVISFFYVFTVILVVTFAIEIGQGFYGTGSMEFDDVNSGIAGFLVFFAIFLVIRAIVHLIIKTYYNKDENETESEDDNDNKIENKETFFD